MSGRPCSACADPRRAELDAALAAGGAFRAIARRFAPLSRDAIRRHRPHVGAAIIRASERKDERREETLRQKVERLEVDALRLAARAEREGDLRAALVANRGLLDVIRFMHELVGKTEAPSVEVRFVYEKLTAAADSGEDEREPMPPPPPPTPAPARPWRMSL
jgi:hypothetical protein